jgi:hypothetical protein
MAAVELAPVSLWANQPPRRQRVLADQNLALPWLTDAWVELTVGPGYQRLWCTVSSVL